MITLHNLTATSLVPYPVVVTPPPPHRQRDLAGRIAHGCSGSVDTAGFNLVLTNEIYTGTSANGIFLGFDFESTPSVLQVKVFHYKVAPGAEGNDPALQPVLIKQNVFEASDGDELTVDGNWDATIGTVDSPPTLDAFPRAVSIGDMMTH